MSELDTTHVRRLLAQPADSVPGQVTRRLFLQGALATGGSLALLPSAFDSLAAAATPVGPDEGILVVIHMGGGNDGLNFVPPRNDGTYRDLRGNAHRQSAWQMIMHCCNHSTQHRGQLITQMRQLGLEEIPATDLVRFWRLRDA